MKKKILIIIILCVFLMSGCINNKKEKNNNTSSNNSVVLYFSATGTTKSIAKKIATKANSDLIEIIPKDKYKKEDLNYNSDCRANKEQNNPDARPEIKNKIDISKYDVIYLGYPIWWGTNPKIILTLLDKYDLKDKIIIPFCTSGSTDITTSINDLRDYNPNLDIKDGKRFAANASDYEIKDFIEKSKIDINSKDKEINKMKVIINDNEYIINLENNSAAKKLVELSPLEVEMAELNGNEKYIYLNDGFPVDSYKPGHIEQGDVMLFDTSCLVIFYKSFDTSYSYTKIGHIDNLQDLGKESVKVKFEKN
ncbi:MAG: hypothetical protein IJ842_01045 [Bacilli bacterium]|nr:hypothetical protein [Bacilli bacterium]